MTASIISSVVSGLADNPIVQRIGWTLIHSLWEGIAVAALLALALRALRGAPATMRYAAGCAAMGLLLSSAIVTFWVVNGPSDRHATSSALTTSIRPDPPLAVSPRPFSMTLAPSRHAASSHMNLLACLAGAWMLGVLCLALRQVGGWLLLGHLRKGPALAKLQPVLESLMNRMHIAAKVCVRDAVRLDVPAVIGVIRPVILIPAALLNELSPSQIEAILAHELAHVRRHDYLVNLIQSAIETLLFYHPATWWISSQIRSERENCCDDMASEICGDTAVYARTLAALEQRRIPNAHLAPAAGGGRLPERIRRVLGLPEPRAHRAGRTRSLAAALLAIACATVPAIVMAQQRTANIAATDSANTRASTQPSPVMIKIGVGENTLIYEGQSVTFETLTKRLNQLPGIHQRALSIEVSAASPQVTVGRYLSAYAQIAGLVNRYLVTSLTQAGILPTTNPDTPFLPPGTEVGEFYMSGVQRGGVYSLTARKISLRQALMAAGGTVADPTTARVTIIRREGDDENAIVKDLSVDDLMHGRVKDVFLRANDMIQVWPEKKQATTVSKAPLPGNPKGWTIDQIATVDPTIRDELHQLSAMEFARANMERRLGAKNSNVVELKQDIDIMKKQIDARAAEFRKPHSSASTRP